jgi:hypothetical protein
MHVHRFLLNAEFSIETQQKCVQIDQKLKWFRPDWINLKLTNFSLYSTEVSKKKKYSHSSNQMFGAIKLIKMYLKELAPQLS